MSIHKRTTKTGQVRYDVRLRKPDGTPYSTTFRTKRDAARFEAKELSDRSQGTWIDPQAGRVLVRDWADEWFSTMTNTWRASTAARHRSALDEHWLPEIGSMRMSSVTPRRLQKLVNELAFQLKPSTIRSYYGTLRSMFSAAVDADIISRSPCRGIKLPSTSESERVVVSPNDLHRLAESAGVDWRCVIYLGGVMGLRFGEIAGLRIEDVDVERSVIVVARAVTEVRGHLIVGPPKTAAGRRALSLPGPLANELQSHIKSLNKSDPNSPLFQDSDGGPIRRSNFRTRVWAPAVKQAQLEGLTFHGLRHSAATTWIAEGVDARSVQHLLGHTDPRLVLRLYAHAEQHALRAAAAHMTEPFWPESSDPSQADS